MHDGEKMESKLYVGNLSYNVSEDDLRELFAQAGTVESATLVRDQDTGRAKGFAFVEMETQEDAEKAISQFNGTQFQNRALNASIARPRENRGGGFGGGHGEGGGRSRSGSGKGGEHRRYR